MAAFPPARAVWPLCRLQLEDLDADMRAADIGVDTDSDADPDACAEAAELDRRRGELPLGEQLCELQRDLAEVERKICRCRTGLRVAPELPGGTKAEVAHAGSQALGRKLFSCMYFARSQDYPTEKLEAFVYILGSHSSIYVGKALLRSGVLSGVSGRIQEHMRCQVLRLPHEFKMCEYPYITRGAITHMVNSMKFSPARQWYQRLSRVAFQGQRVWEDRTSASRFCAEYTSECLPAPVSDSQFVSGATPRGFGTTVAFYSGRLARAQHLSLTIPVALAWILELTLELILLAGSAASPGNATMKIETVGMEVESTGTQKGASGHVVKANVKVGMIAAIGINAVTAPTAIEIETVTVAADTLQTAVRIDGVIATATMPVALGGGGVGRSSPPSEKEGELQKMRDALAERDPEHSTFIKDKKGRVEEMKLRRQGEYMAAATKSAFGDRLSKLEAQKETKESKGVVSRAEVGWLQAIIGKKKSLPSKLTRGQAAAKLEEATRDKAVVSQVNKCIKSRFPRKAVPSSKEKRTSQVLHIIDGPAL
ncbi:unnamed protein product [Prorocentrum cordatum]|uniref:GIY-YIG domain-containing protein n=1 Tax=Prorocentrum cordatum TaxID=2364126 RepID=A0ABN9QTI5_9DINO|nr:unnamed protein product [Polarella glacialis]